MKRAIYFVALFSVGPTALAGALNDLLFMYAPGYTGAGGALNVPVCLVSGQANETQTEVIVQTAIGIWNGKVPTVDNLRTGAASSVPLGSFNALTVFLHEMGHVLGLDHPNNSNLGPAPLTLGLRFPYTKSYGPNGTADLGVGPDGVAGSPDDARVDDTARVHHTTNNDPFALLGVPVDVLSFPQSTTQIPPGDSWPAIATREVAAAMGYGSAESVMTVPFYDRDRKVTLVADDVDTGRLVESGFDGTAGTADDYTVNLQYVGIDDDCMGIRVKWFNNPGSNILATATHWGTAPLPVLNIGGEAYSRITSTYAEIRMNAGKNWDFSTGPNPAGGTGGGGGTGGSGGTGGGGGGGTGGTTEAPGCAPAPQAVCDQSLVGSLAISGNGRATGRFKGPKFSVTPPSQVSGSEIGVSVCLYYDGTLTKSWDVPGGAGAGWRVNRQGYRWLHQYAAGANPSGLKKLDIYNNRIGLRGEGGPMPDPGVSQVDLQFVSAAGDCWGEDWSGAEIRRVAPLQVKEILP